MIRTFSAFLAVGLWALVSAQAEDFVVTNLDDSGPGSLRQAVLDAEANSEPDNITFDGSLSGQIDLGDQIWIDNDLTITGFPEDPSRITIDGGGEDRIIVSTCEGGAGEAVTIEGLTLTHGRTESQNPFGGAIHTEDCDLNLRDMVITNNLALGMLDGVESGYGGGVSVSEAKLSVIDSIISDNVAGDGVTRSNGAGGGIYAEQAQVEIEGSVISNNAAISVDLFGGDVGGGGVGAFQSSLVILKSTISGNLAGNRADAADATVDGVGGGVIHICLDCSTGLRIEDSTISGNIAGNTGTSGPVFARGGGLLAVGNSTIVNSTTSGNVVGDLVGANTLTHLGAGMYIANRGAPPMVVSSTITGNQALGPNSRGGGTFHDDGTVQLHNTIIAGNSAAIGPDARGQFDSSYSIIENQSDVVFNSGSAIAGSPNLGPLTDNGGPTETHAISDTSSAFNAGDPLDCPSLDQRGVVRPQLGGCDIGAFELAAPQATLTELFESLVEAGDLTGDGKGKSAPNRLNAMGNKVAAIDAFIEQGDIEQACEDLASALLKTDGEKRPPDFVKGSGTATLAAAIEQTQTDLGCN